MIQKRGEIPIEHRRGGHSAEFEIKGVGEQCGTITTIYLFAAEDEDRRLLYSGILIDEEGFAEYARRVTVRVERLVCPYQN